MTSLTIDRFADFFNELHCHAPYPWQKQLAERAINGEWPGAIDLPTGSGKTACIDIAVFAMACQASLPVDQQTARRRVFFCVNRRVIVDEAYNRARCIAKKIGEAENNGAKGSPVLRDVAAKLRQLSGTTANDGAPPLDVLELRGGIYRDNRWARSITQPTIVCTTIDQLGSRLLFRGYGVSRQAAPIQAALIAYDSLILLDEAHISRPFLQTLDYVQRYLDPKKWVEQDIGIKPAVVVPMTATPPEGVTRDQLIRLTDADRRHGLLSQRLTARKPAEFRAVDDKKFVKAVVDVAIDLAGNTPTAVGIMVNRVATAKKIYEALRNPQKVADERQQDSHGKRKKKNNKPRIAPDATVDLVIGSMRPIDRDVQADRLRNHIGPVGPNRPPVTEKTSFVVATQCLEVGADYDFDVLVTECASLDALRQRFGRLNRAGRSIDAKSVVVANNKDVKPNDKLDDDKPLDPIYGNALARTWNWLDEHANEVTTDGATTVRQIDFGIDAFNKSLKEHGEDGRIPPKLLAPSASLNAPVMLPAYLDLLCQTAPRPALELDVSLFLHGIQRGEPYVQVCWRADFVEDKHMNRDHWCDVVALLPPTSAECMTVPISRARRWLAKLEADKKTDENEGDLLGASSPDESDAGKNESKISQKSARRGVIWRGFRNSRLIETLADLRPGDTLVLPVSAGGWDELGHIPIESHSTQTNGAASDSQPRTCPLDTHGQEVTSETNAADDSASETPNSASNDTTVEVEHTKIDIAEKAFQTARDRAVLRLHPSLRKLLPDGDAIAELFDRAANGENPPTKEGEWRKLLKVAANSLPQDHPVAADMRKLADTKYGLRRERYPDDCGVVLATRRRIGTAWFLPALDDGEDETSCTRREQSVLLAHHTDHVLKMLKRALLQCPLKHFAALELAAKLHDLGKADERFQAMLRRTDRTDAWLLAGATSNLLAKSDGMPMTRSQRDAARRRAGLPDGFRHEMLSVQLAERFDDLPKEGIVRDLVLHLIAAHHGQARPFAPVVIDEGPPMSASTT